MNEREIDRFEAASDDGTVFTVIEYQSFTTFRSLSGPSSTAKGLKRLVLSDGSAVNYINAETFKIVQTDQIIRKIG